MTKKQSPTSSNWLKNNPTLTEVENYFGRIKDGDVIRCLFFGSFLDPENNQMYRFPAALIVSVVDAMKNLIAIYVPDCNAQWWVQPIEPYTFEVFTDNQRFSLKIYDISEEEWPPHIREWHEWFANDSPVSGGKPEELTRLELIDPALAECGWTTEMIIEEFTFTSKVDESHNRVDYVLSVLDENGKKHQKIAFIEAKHRGRPADFGLGQARAYGYLAQAQIRFVFATNGIDFIEFDRLTETTSIPKPIREFPTPAELRENWLASSRQIDKPFEKLPIRRSGLDQNSIMDARAIAELLLPVEAVRVPCLTLMAETIRYANEFGSGKWEVSLAKSGRLIRVNVGRLEVAAIFHNFIHVILDDEMLSETNRLAIGRYALLYEPPIYSSVPSSVGCNFRADLIDIVRPLIWKSHQSLIRKAAETVGWRTGWYKLHSPAVIAYLREATNQTIPDPDYSELKNSSRK